MEKRAVNDMFVIISDIWLDNEEVIHVIVYLSSYLCFLFCFPTGLLWGHACMYSISNLSAVLSVEKTMRKLETILDALQES